MINDIKAIVAIIIIAALAVIGYYGYNAVLEKGQQQARLECQQ